jgi:predicted nuclease of predicted toxin-antitoxin system
MKFKVDENLPLEVVNLFEEAGFDASSVLQQKMGGQPDNRIILICREEARTLITLDTDFADISTYPPADYPGILVLRLKQYHKHHVLDIIRRVVPLLRTEPVEGRLWIIGEEKIRMRG